MPTEPQTPDRRRRADGTWRQLPGQAWRVTATALAFGTFGLGGLVLGLLVFPLLGLLVRPAPRRRHMARALVGCLFRCFVAEMRLLGLLTVQLEGLERLQRRGLLVLANHPSLIDVVFLIGWVPDAHCVVKASLRDNPCTRGPVQATGYICNNTGADLMQTCVDSVHQGGNLIIFPEGTRTRPGQPLKMQRGAAQIALRGGLPITPVRIRCDPPGLYKGQPWWRVGRQVLHFRISVEPDLPSAPFLQSTQGEPALAARRLTEFLTHYFSGNHNNDPIAGGIFHAATRDQGAADLSAPT